jgi:hypothetical protein
MQKSFLPEDVFPASFDQLVALFCAHFGVCKSFDVLSNFVS